MKGEEQFGCTYFSREKTSSRDKNKSSFDSKL